jgi:DNA-binding NarL/FixJ family response regulator
LQVVGDASTAAEATAKCDELRPDVVLMDIRMPGASGIEACRWIKERHPATRILFLTSYSDSDTLVEALSAGADGYVLKAVNGQDIVEAVEKVARGDAIVDPGVARQLIQLAAGNSPRATPGAPRSTSALTDRENRILELLNAGHTNKEIASALGLSEKTVRNLLSGVFGKLGASTRQEAAQRWLASRQS